MSSQAEVHASNVAELAPYRALIVVDMKDFSGVLGRHHAALTEEIPRILRDTFTRAGLADMWDDRRFYGTTGDGYVLGFRAALLPYLINPFLRELQNELAYRNRAANVGSHGEPIRMRVSINVGPVTDTGENTITDGSGDARIETHRLLDAQPVRDLLARSTEATCIAAIVSARAFEDAVLSGFADDSPDFYVQAPVEVKTYQGTAYLRVPCPTGDLLNRGFRLVGDAPEDGEGTPRERDVSDAGAARNSVGDTVIRGGNVGIGSLAGTAGNVYSGVEGPVHTGSGDQFNAPVHTGKGDQLNAPTTQRRSRGARGDR